MTSWIQTAEAGRAGSQLGCGEWGRRVGGGGAKVLVEITSSTPAPRSIATIEVKAPRGEEEGDEEEGRGGGGGG